ncbi:alpha-N-arabinofuranosidase [Bradyrhizobium sp. LTSP849]|uniref:arabinosylfuranosidase ArfA n=1 Tax=unclassified Bradyrhizobium TaxID=2631580 RepID=UPI0005D14D43|nr:MULTISPECIES: alpha-N-arabinofuranosidase [unclassified Bradyrhizobium]KJC35073.1 alpha-N-arabinofuranosidase [Bradyrhizobium sp. LTSP857]KJC39564.1 alpha-N-arabinofuranosidase [Bradyrhizobium sp. LTSP849]
MRKANVLMDRDFAIGHTDPRLFGAFVEHLGRCVYGGIYEPGHPTADKSGFRGDVLALVRELGPTIIRYPGGNFVSGYNWEDGVGPVDRRPARLDLAWFSTEPNKFGTNEFIDWCKAAEVEPMMAVNLGTRGGDAARNLVEYCNHPGGSAWSDLRRAHGWEKPHNVRFWCLGNEMDGPWQMEHKSADAYGTIAREAAKMMRWVDPTIELAACGSSGRNMPTFGQWEDAVIEHTFDHAEYISLHTYLNNYKQDAASFLASSDLMDNFIDEVVALADAVAAKRRSSKRMMLSFDEWNVWYRTRRNRADRVKEGWPVAPSILEEIYTMEDALAFGGACISLLNHADRVRTACLAQLVNAIAPIMTETGGSAWRQTIFFPFAHMSRLGRGKVLRTQVESDTYDSSYFDPRGIQEFTFPVSNVAYLKIAAVAGEAGGLSLFMLNRDLKQEMEVSLEARSFGRLIVSEALELCHDDLQATNTRDAAGRVKPEPLQGVAIDGTRMRATLKPASWNVVHLSAQ